MAFISAFMNSLQSVFNFIATGGYGFSGTVTYDQADNGTNSINWQPTSAAANNKFLWRFLPKGTGAGTNNDKAEITLGGDGTPTWWMDLKTGQVGATDRRGHILTDSDSGVEPITKLIVELDLSNRTTSVKEFTIVREATYAASTDAQKMLRILEGSGITHIDSGTVALASGNLVIGTAAGDTVVNDEIARPFSDGGTALGSTSSRFATIHLRDYAYFSEIADPSAPAADRALLYCKDNGSGKSQLAVRFATGAVQVIATEP